MPPEHLSKTEILSVTLEGLVKSDPALTGNQKISVIKYAREADEEFQNVLRDSHDGFTALLLGVLHSKYQTTQAYFERAGNHFDVGMALLSKMVSVDSAVVAVSEKFVDSLNVLFNAVTIQHQALAYLKISDEYLIKMTQQRSAGNYDAARRYAHRTRRSLMHALHSFEYAINANPLLRDTPAYQELHERINLAYEHVGLLLAEIPHEHIRAEQTAVHPPENSAHPQNLSDLSQGFFPDIDPKPNRIYFAVMEVSDSDTGPLSLSDRRFADVREKLEEYAFLSLIGHQEMRDFITNMIHYEHPKLDAEHQTVIASSMSPFVQNSIPTDAVVYAVPVSRIPILFGPPQKSYAPEKSFQG